MLSKNLTVDLQPPSSNVSPRVAFGGGQTWDCLRTGNFSPFWSSSFAVSIFLSLSIYPFFTRTVHFCVHSPSVAFFFFVPSVQICRIFIRPVGMEHPTTTKSSDDKLAPGVNMQCTWLGDGFRFDLSDGLRLWQSWDCWHLLYNIFFMASRIFLNYTQISPIDNDLFRIGMFASIFEVDWKDSFSPKHQLKGSEKRWFMPWCVICINACVKVPLPRLLFLNKLHKHANLSTNPLVYKIWKSHNY